MATANQTENRGIAERKGNEIQYVPLGQKSPVKLSLAIVRRFLARPTKAGHPPDDMDVMKFMMLCRARQLDPWQGDVYLVGYDGKDGPEFSLITSVQALLKRAEAQESFDGMESGVVVEKDGKLDERQGEILLENEVLVGAWSRVWREDRKRPFYASVNFRSYSKLNKFWQTDPAGMIVKCAKAKVLREAFPGSLAGLYTEDEFGGRGLVVDSSAVSQPEPAGGNGELDQLADQLEKKRAEAPAAEKKPRKSPKKEKGKDKAASKESPEADDPIVAEAHRLMTSATTYQAVEDIYDGLCGPESTTELTPEQRERVEALRQLAHKKIAAESPPDNPDPQPERAEAGAITQQILDKLAGCQTAAEAKPLLGQASYLADDQQALVKTAYRERFPD